MKQFKKCWVYLGCADRDEQMRVADDTFPTKLPANDQPGVEVEHQPATKHVVSICWS